MNAHKIHTVPQEQWKAQGEAAAHARAERAKLEAGILSPEEATQMRIGILRTEKPKKENKDILHAEAENWMFKMEQPDTANAFRPDALVHGHDTVLEGVAIVRKFLETSTWPKSKKGQDLPIGEIFNGIRREDPVPGREPDMDAVRYFVAGYNYALGKLGIEVEEP